MIESANTIFFGCNYNDKKVKTQFDNLKKRIEQDTPISCIVVDKRRGKPARDLWRDIKAYIENSAACIFDLTGFRPNVVLELGYALSIKAEDQIFITFRTRKTKGQAPKWILSDIGHLQRFEYVQIAALESHVRDQLRQIPFYQGYERFLGECDNTTIPDQYKESGLKILQKLRDDGPKSDQQLKALIAGAGCHFSRMSSLLKSSKVAVRGRGPHGKFSIPQNDR